MRRMTAFVILGAALSVGSMQAAAGGIEVRLGGFLPRADSSLFDDTADLFGTTQSDWRHVTGGLEFAGNLAPGIELGVHVDGYSRSLDTSYREFTRPSGREIQQTLELTMVPVGLTLRVVPGGRDSFVRPYVGAGVDLVFWKYEEFGDFIDFDSPNLDVVPDAFESDGVKAGFHVAGGLRVRISDDLSLTGEARYLFAGRAVMGDDFEARGPGLENELDLNGASFTVGLNLRF